MTLRAGYINAVLTLVVVVLFGVACYLHLDCRNLEAMLAEGKGAEAEIQQVLSRMTVEPSLPLESQLEELRTELAEAEAERQRLEQEVAELEEARKSIQEENTLTMAELAELDPKAYAEFAGELKEYYSTYRSGCRIDDQRKMLSLVEEKGLLKISEADRRMCEEYFSAYQEYVDGVLDGVWSEEETQERYQQLQKLYQGYGEFLNKIIYEKGLCAAYGVSNWQEVDGEMSKVMHVASALTMTEVWKYGSVLSNRYAREMLEQDCPELDYGLAPGEEDEAVRHLEECFAYRREHP
ncbi:MAG: hypothetical protein IKS83_02685 [Victivallales bacterium]|nr:hypothetical protein [Victivallales bacterium]